MTGDAHEPAGRPQGLRARLAAALLRFPAGKPRLAHAVRSARWPVLVALVLAATVAVNVLAGSRPLRWDLTAERRFSLSDQTVKVLRSLDRPVRITAVVHRGTQDGDLLEALVREYRRKSRRVSFEIVDFSRAQNRARALGVTAPNTLLVEADGKRRQVEGFNIFTATADGVQFKGEQALTRAVLEVTGRTGRKVYFLEGHGEPALGGELARLRDLTEGEGYALDSLNLTIKGSVPADAAAVVVLGPEQDMAPKEADALLAYRRKGGRLFLLVDPLPGRPLPELARVPEAVGVTLREEVAVDPVRAFFGDPTTPVPETRFHTVTEPLAARRLNMVLPGARLLAEAKKGDLTVTRLLETSPAAWGERNPLAPQLRRDADEPGGPLLLAAAVTEPPTPGGGASGGGTATAGGAGGGTSGGAATGAAEGGQRPVAVVVGNSAFVRGSALTVRGNLDFFLNALGWLVGQEELISVRPKALTLPRANVFGPAANRIFYGTVVFMPLALVAAGGRVWLRRRRL